MVRVTRGGAGSVSRSENRPHAGGRAAYRASLRASRIGRAALQYDDFLGETDVRRRFSDFFVHAQQGVASDPGNADPNVPGYLGGGTLHLHGDLIRSTLLRTEEGGQAVAVSGGPSAVVSYTAFGEPVWTDPNGVVQVGLPPTGLGTRYQYAGGWGYETGLAADDGGFRGGLAAGSPSRFVWDTTAAGPGELGRGPGASQGLGSPEGGWAEFAAGSGRPDEFRPADDVLGLAGVNSALPPLRLLHVGWRWYDPSRGRCVQRDPIGLAGGVNGYLYCRGNPLSRVDPWGLWDWDAAKKGAVIGGIGGSLFGPGGTIAGVGGGFVLGGLTGNPWIGGVAGTGLAGAGRAVLTYICVHLIQNPQGTTYYVVDRVRSTVGGDGGTSIIRKHIVDGVTRAVEHIVLDPDGNVIHRHWKVPWTWE